MFPEDYLLDPDPSPEERELACPACGHCWHADGYRDADGRWWPATEDDSYCPVCGVEGEA
jgi:hypothetical protein